MLSWVSFSNIYQGFFLSTNNSFASYYIKNNIPLSNAAADEQATKQVDEEED